jgi:hypothetical protein
MVEAWGVPRAKHYAEEGFKTAKYQTERDWWQAVSIRIAPPPPPKVLTPMERLEKYMMHRSLKYTVVQGDDPHIEIRPDQPEFSR